MAKKSCYYRTFSEMHYSHSMVPGGLPVTS